MANSNYSVSNKLFAYISHGIDITDEIKTNYASSLIFIGDEGQIYSPINNTYVGIGQTAYTNLLAYTLYINERIDELAKIMASSLVSKIYAQYDDYDTLTSKGKGDGDITTLNTAMQELDASGESWRADYATTYVTFKGTGDYDPNTGLAYTTYTIPNVHPNFSADDLGDNHDANRSGATGPFYYATINDSKYVLNTVHFDKDANTYVLYESPSKGQNVIAEENKVPNPYKIQEQDVYAANSAFGTSGITISLEKDPNFATANTDSFGNVTYTYTRNIVRIDDSLTWSYIASAYTYTMGFAKTWATTEANRIYNNLIGGQTTYVPVSWDYISQYGQTTIAYGYINATYIPAAGNDYHFSAYETLYVRVITDTYQEISDLLNAETLQDAKTSTSVANPLHKSEYVNSIQMNGDGRYYVIVKWVDYAEYLRITYGTATYEPIEALSYAGSGTTNLSTEALIYYVANTSEYDSTYNTNIADGIQTLKEVAYLLDVLTDGFGSVTRYEVLAYTDVTSNDNYKYAGSTTNSTATKQLDEYIIDFTKSHDVASSDITAINAYGFVTTSGEIVWLNANEFEHSLTYYRNTYGDAQYAVVNYKTFVAGNTTQSTSSTGSHTEYTYIGKSWDGDSAYYVIGIHHHEESDLTDCYAYFKVATTAEPTSEYYTQVGDTIYRVDNVAAIINVWDGTSYTDKYEIRNYDGVTSSTEGAQFDNDSKQYYTSSTYDLYVLGSETQVHYDNAIEVTNVIAKIIETTDTDNLGIKMAYTIAGNQEQINTLNNRVQTIENGEYVLRSIDTTGSTYVTLTSVSNREAIQVGNFSYNVGDTSINVALQFGSTYTSEYKYNEILVPIAYTDIAKNQNAYYYYDKGEDGPTAVSSSASITEAEVSKYFVKAEVGYRRATYYDYQTGVQLYEFDAPVIGTSINALHTDKSLENYTSWADEKATYYILNTRGTEGQNTTHAALNSQGITYTSWVTSYVADTYTLVNDSLIALKADIVNTQKDMLGGLQYSNNARSSEFVAYTYQWNGLVGTANRELPTDEIYANSEVWGERTSTNHVHQFTQVTVDKNKIDTTGKTQYFRQDGYEYVALALNNYGSDWQDKLNSSEPILDNDTYLYYIDENGNYTQTSATTPNEFFVNFTKLYNHFTADSTIMSSGARIKNDYSLEDYGSYTYVRTPYYGDATGATYLYLDQKHTTGKITKVDGKTIDVTTKGNGAETCDVYVTDNGLEIGVLRGAGVGEYIGYFAILNEVVDADGNANVNHEDFTKLYYKTAKYIEVDNQDIQVNVTGSTLTRYSITYNWTDSIDTPSKTASNNVTIGWEFSGDGIGTYYYPINASTYLNSNAWTDGANIDDTTGNSFTTPTGVSTKEKSADISGIGIVYDTTDNKYYTYIKTITPDIAISATDDNGKEYRNNLITYADTKSTHNTLGTNISFSATEVPDSTKYVVNLDAADNWSDYTVVYKHDTGTDIDTIKIVTGTWEGTDNSYDGQIVDGVEYTLIGGNAPAYLYATSEYVTLYTRCDNSINEVDGVAKSTKYVDANYTHKSWLNGGMGENVMQVTTYITYLENAANADNTGLADAHDVRTFIDNVIEWVDLSASVTASIKDSNSTLYSAEHYNPLNTKATSYTTATQIRIKHIDVDSSSFGL